MKVSKYKKYYSANIEVLRQKGREYYRKNKNIILEKLRARRASNPVSHNAAHRAYNAEYRAKNPQRIRNFRLKNKYGLNQGDYEAMLSAQGGTCAICGTGTPGGRGSFKVDHNHADGKIRGLLCSNCNTGLGLFKDSVFNLAKAVEYLTKERA